MWTYIGLKLIQSKGFTNIWLERNSPNIIQCLENTCKPSWSIKSLIFDSCNIINYFDECISSIFTMKVIS